MALELELDEIQGNVLAGFNKDYATFLFFELPDDEAKARTWLADVVPDVATTRQVKTFNDLFRSLRNAASILGPNVELPAIAATWMNLAFTHRGLELLGVDAKELEDLPAEFRDGMRARADSIGDVGESAPANWPEPFGESALHVLMIVAADRLASRNLAVESFVGRAKEHGLRCVFRQEANARRDAPGREHFGFRDGISQPGVAGFTENPGVGQDLVQPGEFVLGYPRETDDSTDVQHAWLRNGSYVVFRRLAQNVPGFDAFVRDGVARTGLCEELFRAKLLGRYRSGAPLARANGDRTDPGVASAEVLASDRINDFLYDDDPEGERVPRAAHIRKVFPRGQKIPGAEEVRRRRIMRRGLPFGNSFVPDAARASAYGAEAGFPQDRGLCFLCYQRSIADQFEFIQQSWVNDHAYPKEGDGIDPVASQMENSFYSLPGATETPLSLTRQWVTTTGGDYFFAPSIGAMKQFAQIA